MAVPQWLLLLVMCGHSGLQGSWYPKVQLVTKEPQLATLGMVSDPVFQDQT